MKLAAVAFVTAATLLGQPALTQAEIDALIPKIRNSALRYRGQLPNFVAHQKTSRRENTAGSESKWKQKDTYEEELTFAGNTIPTFRLLSVNGTPATPQMKKPPGAIDPGMLSQAIVPTWIFGPRSQVALSWARWDTRRDQRAMVLSFKVPQVVELQRGEKVAKLGFHGTLWINEADLSLVRIESTSDLPKEDELDRWAWKIDYDTVRIADKDLVLPVRLVIETRSGKTWFENTETFSNYRQFSASSNIVGIEETRER